MITVNEWWAGGKGGGGSETGGMSVQSMGELGKEFSPNFLQPKPLPEGAVTTEPGTHSNISQPSTKLPTHILWFFKKFI